MKLIEAAEVLHKLHFNIFVQRKGRGKKWKFLHWTTLKGMPYQTCFSPETPYEEVIEFAKTQLPVWDKKLLFDVGDAIELDWGFRRVRATIKSIPTHLSHYYELESAELPTLNKQFTNYDLKFHKNAVLVDREKSLEANDVTGKERV